MKNLKVNENIFKKGKMVLLPITMATIITLSGCSLIPNGDRARYSDNNSNTDFSYSSKDTSIDNTTSNTAADETIINDTITVAFGDYYIPMKDTSEGKKTTTKINFTNSNYNSIKSYLNSLNVIYEYENLYNFNESLTEYNKLNLVNTHSNKLKNITVDELYNMIVNNNKEYKKSVKTSIYKELNSNEIRQICELIVETVNKYIKENKDIKVDRIKCVLSNLKMYKQTSSVANAFVTDDNCLIISPNMLEVASLINGKGTDKDIFIHEIVHLLQKGCNCDLENNSNLKRNFGISYGFNNVKVNSLDFTWLYEASAEKNMMNLTGHDPLVYQNMIGYLESLSLVNLVDDNYNVKGTEELSFKRSLNDLYNYFEVTTDGEKKEILNMMYSIEIMQQAPTDFYKVLEEQTGKNKTSILVDEVNYTVKVSICETLSKLFYRNLSKNIVNKDVTLEDVFYLISLFENDLNSHIKYKDSEKYSYNEEFINTYIDIQNNFFYQLSKSMNCSQEDIENKFDNYTAYIKNSNGGIVNNYSLSFLNKEKIDYLKEREDAINLSATISIKNASKVFSKNNLQKVYN